jgi:hypothetical protein
MTGQFLELLCYVLFIPEFELFLSLPEAPVKANVTPLLYIL